jgi:hypothetical protein
MLFSRLLHFLPLRFLAALHQKALVVPHGYSWAFTIRPNDLREDRLPRDITESIHWLVSTRYIKQLHLPAAPPARPLLSGHWALARIAQRALDPSALAPARRACTYSTSARSLSAPSLGSHSHSVH